MAQSGSVVASFAPDATYTRHSEGDFERLYNDHILFVYSRFTQSQDDDAPSDLVAIESDDDGQTWGEPRVLITASQFDTDNIMSVSLLRMGNMDLGVFFIVKRRDGMTDIVLARSANDALSFYKYTTCTPADRPGYYVLNNARVIKLRSGRILIPLAYHRSCWTKDGKHTIDQYGTACFLYSDDDGETWQWSPETVSPPFNQTTHGLQETGVIELENGVIWAYNRTDKMAQYEYFSMDGGLHWTVPQPSRFTSPPSPMTIVRHPATDDLIAVWNPIPNYNTRVQSKAGWGRTPLVYAWSFDEGKTWTKPDVIEDDPEHGYCYPAAFFTNDGCMLVAYCSGGPEDGVCLARLTIRKLAV